MTTARNTDKRDIHQEITDSIIAAIESAAKVGEMPWHGARSPYKLSDNTCYRGINRLVLSLKQVHHQYSSAQWGTFRAWKEAGGCVRKGEKGSTIVFYKLLECTDRSDPKKKECIPLLRYSNVWNRDQVEGLNPDEFEDLPCIAKPDDQAVITAREIVTDAGAVLVHGGTRACYMPQRDVIQMPLLDAFKDTKTYSAAAGYAAVLLHEAIHWTGHPTRLDRISLNKEDNKAEYAFEELVAELGASFLCADHGIMYNGIEDHAGYIASWLRHLRNDNKAIFRASTQASNASQLISEKANEKVKQ